MTQLPGRPSPLPAALTSASTAESTGSPGAVSAQETGPHGTVWTLRHGAVEAQVAQAGAALLGLRHGTDWLTEPTPLDRSVAAGNGQVLVPWPNRIRDGRWLLDGAVQQLPLTEPARHNASHGLLRSAEYRLVSGSQESVRLAARIFPVTGYPFRVDHTVTYAVSATGLRVTHELRNHSPAPAPVALGAHPYLRVGDVPVAECSLQVAAQEWLRTDDHLIPVSTEPLDPEHDWRTARTIGRSRPDTCWTTLTPEPDGLVRHRLRAPDGSGVDLWADPAFGHVQVFVTDRLPGREVAIAVEPMTAAPDAFNSGDGLVWLPTGDSLTLSWGIEAVLG